LLSVRQLDWNEFRPRALQMLPTEHGEKVVIASAEKGFIMY